MKGETQPQRRENSHLEQDICIHIFTVSSAMVGVCLTVIGLIRVIITLGSAETLADDFLAADALLFLTSSLLSYWALRSRGLRRMHRLEKVADGIFIIAMIGMVVVCALITYTISVPARPYHGQQVGRDDFKTSSLNSRDLPKLFG
jgi:cytochrome c oxidase assembly factor CtaG